MNTSVSSQVRMVMLGLPEAGKSTFLAAHWSLLIDPSQRGRTQLQVSAIPDDISYFERLAERYRRGESVARTSLSEREPAELLLATDSGTRFSLVIPDWSGEIVRGALEHREWAADVDELVRSADGVLVFVRANAIKEGLLLSDALFVAADLPGMGEEANTEETGEPVLEDPQIPTDVALVDLFQVLDSRRTDPAPNKVSLVISAWDVVPDGAVRPDDFVATRLPMLTQFLRWTRDRFDVRVFGISAQGAELEALAPLLSAENQLERIRVSQGGELNSDLTRVFRWML
jgi:hypothetical protein